MRSTILVPLDGSPGSESVIPAVAEVARPTRARVRLLRVLPPPEAVRVDGHVVAYADQETARIEAEQRGYLRTVAQRLTGLDVDCCVRFGDPATEILAEAAEATAGLIAMASRQRRLGWSVARRVWRGTSIPVLLVRAAPPAGARRAAAGQRRRYALLCPLAGREVEVTMEEQGPRGFRRPADVVACSAFDPVTAVTCRRECLDAAVRWRWSAAPPVPADAGIR